MPENYSLLNMYQDMLGHIKDFNQKNYADLFKTFVKQYGPEILELTEYAKTLSMDEREAFYTGIARELSEHVKNIISGKPERQKQKYSVDHNVTMVAYLLPLVTYYKLPECMAFGETLVKVWNENQTTTNSLQLSSFDAISGGFKKSIFCYITTAVCETLEKPDDCYELTLLRNYRDSYLAHSEGGLDLIKEYYEIAPRLVLSIDTFDDRDQIYRNLYQEYILPCIHSIENEEPEICKDLYVKMVRSLEEQYIVS